jgi:hypothetical protein
MGSEWNSADATQSVRDFFDARVKVVRVSATLSLYVGDPSWPMQLPSLKLDAVVCAPGVKGSCDVTEIAVHRGRSIRLDYQLTVT